VMSQRSLPVNFSLFCPGFLLCRRRASTFVLLLLLLAVWVVHCHYCPLQKQHWGFGRVSRTFVVISSSVQVVIEAQAYAQIMILHVLRVVTKKKNLEMPFAAS
jgi:hypothetical protein